MVTANDSALGKAYGFSDIASLNGEVWVVFAASDHNSEIVRLGPAFAERRTLDSVPIESKDGGRRWLLPGVEIAIHRVDLTASRLLAEQPFSVIRISEDFPLQAGKQEEDSSLLKKLDQVAEAIEARLHYSPEVAEPRLDDCVLDMLDSVKQSASFVWSHDRHRSYLLERIRDNWTLTQRYADPCAIEADIIVPLETGKGLVQFNSEGRADLSVDQCAAIRAQFGFSFLTEAATPPEQRAMDMARRILRMILTLPSSMAGGMSLAPSFSTSESQQDKPEHCIHQSIQIGDVGSGETLEVVCESYANHPQSVDLKVAVVNPKTLKAGARVGVTLGSGGEDAPRVEVILADDRKGGLYGLGEFAMPWDKFAGHGTAVGLELEIDLHPAEE